ncbi:polysaccharide biosynthesis tyrosine autokinase [Tessaracoccus oleiagri]|uniref:non-specific protein-tyrosine kinase n=1 Tax=Tessaracoccus oleiagri TaxID=686624 RepID=A0A1G9N5Q8_9ACTN|nr:polysaccharide biosynthesis tyrosine autokinase [Tessaracoccus oleiagri]SDL81876.1 capsular exopolysaccharide family [Tessaracoccus oleiagri]
MELQQYLQIVRRYWRSTLATVLACIVLAALFTLLQKPTYTSTSSVFLTVESGGTAGELSQGATYAERQVTSYVSVATTALVLDPVIQELELDSTPARLAGKLSVSAPASTSIIKIAAEDDSATGAAELSNAVANSLLNAVDELAPPGPEGNRLVSATVIDSALIPASPSAPRPALNLALGGLLGVVLGLGQAILRSVLDTRVRTTDDVAEITEAPVLASINTIDTSADRAAPVDGVAWANAEAYRRLRTNVGFVGLGGERRSSMVVTSSVAGEGKTQTATNLARVLAEAGESVLLVDADLRRPQVANRMRLDSQLGLSDVLTGRGRLQELVINVIPGRLAVLPAGTVPPNPSELLGSEAMAHLLTSVERQYDYVVFDAPPLLPVTDSVVLAAQAGGAVVVVRSGVVKTTQLEGAVELLRAGEVTIFGIVLNDVPLSRADAYAGYYSSVHDEGVAWK